MRDCSLDEAETFDGPRRLTGKTDHQRSANHGRQPSGENRVRGDLQGTHPHCLSESRNFAIRNLQNSFGSHVPDRNSRPSGGQDENTAGGNQFPNRPLDVASLIRDHSVCHHNPARCLGGIPQRRATHILVVPPERTIRNGYDTTPNLHSRENHEGR